MGGGIPWDAGLTQGGFDSHSLHMDTQITHWTLKTDGRGHTMEISVKVAPFGVYGRYRRSTHVPWREVRSDGASSAQDPLPSRTVDALTDLVRSHPILCRFTDVVGMGPARLWYQPLNPV